MTGRRNLGGTVVLALAGLSLGLVCSRPAAAHCDTMEGPVVKSAQAALAKGDVTPVLKWVKQENEAEIRDIFAEALAVRRQGGAAAGLADRYFFETLVRLHREGEGAPYTGLKPAGSESRSAIAGADRALETGSVEALTRRLTEQVTAGVRERFARALEARKHAEKSVAAGRKFVETYVEFLHYVERLDFDASHSAAPHDAPGKSEAEKGHGH